jgi:predicted MFS family arabinose efflux permease
MTKNRWFVLAILFVARTSMALQFQTVGSLGPGLVRELGIDYALLGTLIGLYMLPGVFMALPGGLVGQRFGARRAVLAGLALMALGGAMMGIASSFPVMAAGRLISGVGAVLLNVLLTKMVADWFAGREIVTAMSLLIVSWPVGIGIGLMTFVPLSLAHGPSAVMHVVAGLSLVALVLIALAYRDPPGAASETAARLAIDLSGREWLLVGLAGLIWGTYNVAYIAFVTFTPEFLTTRSLSLAEASSITSLISWSLIVSIPLAGHLAERWRRPNLFMLGGLALAALAIVAFVLGVSTIASFTVLVLFVGWPAGLIMALPAETLRPEARASGMGVFYTLYYVWMALLPGLAGMSRDLAGSPAAPVLFSAAMLTAAGLCLLVFRAVQNRRPMPGSPGRRPTGLEYIRAAGPPPRPRE